jgi:NADP-dependent 3-hydroxy acid dehydrogenase YdfG
MAYRYASGYLEGQREHNQREANMARNLREQVIIVTGASSGIGRGIAEQLARKGARVILAARRNTELSYVAEAINERDGEALPIPTDVTVQKDVDNLVHQTLKKYGQIDLLVNNAGIVVYGDITKLNIEDFERVFATNILGLVRCTKSVIPYMLERKRGTIINISSGAGKMGYAGGTAYCASKHAVNGFSSALYQDLREHGIQVYTVCPGAVDVERMGSRFDDKDRKKMLNVEDIADLVEFLATRDSTVSFEDLWIFSRLRG